MFNYFKIMVALGWSKQTCLLILNTWYRPRHQKEAAKADKTTIVKPCINPGQKRFLIIKFGYYFKKHLIGQEGETLKADELFISSDIVSRHVLLLSESVDLSFFNFLGLKVFHSVMLVTQELARIKLAFLNSQLYFWLFLSY